MWKAYRPYHRGSFAAPSATWHIQTGLTSSVATAHVLPENLDDNALADRTHAENADRHVLLPSRVCYGLTVMLTSMFGPLTSQRV